jgi:hypothetical protein
VYQKSEPSEESRNKSIDTIILASEATEDTKDYLGDEGKSS